MSAAGSEVDGAGSAAGLRLDFGRGHLPLSLPAHARPTVVAKHPMPALPDPAGSVRRALAEPVGSAPLAELAAGRRSACLLICDITRPVPNHLFLRSMIQTIHAAGVPLDRITVLVATGLHRPNLGAELAELVGDPWVLEHVAVVNHDARDDAAHVDLGPTPRGTPVKLDRRLVEADLRIATGLVEPHFMAGWSGGRKVIAPGVASHETIRTFHSAAFMEDPLAVQCNLVGNPLHTEQLEIVARLGEVYGLNTVLDEQRNLVAVTFGEVLAAHAAAVEVIEAACHVEVPQRFATVVTSSAGHPLDQTYYQTVKSMVTPLDALAPGGTLLVASSCSEGLGSPEFRAAQARLVELGPERFLATLTAKTLADVDEWQSEMQLKAMRVGRVVLYAPGLDADERALTGVTVTDDLDTAVAEQLAASGDPRLAVIPEGPYVVPRLAVG